MAVSTVRVPLSTTEYTQIGDLPLQVQIVGGGARLVVAAELPDLGEAAGMFMGPDSPITTFTATGTLYGLALSGAAIAITNPTS